MPRERALILVVDPAAGVKALPAGALDDAGYRVIRCANPEEAKDVVERYHPDVVIASAELPAPGARTLLGSVRASHPVIRGILVDNPEGGAPEPGTDPQILVLHGPLEPRELLGPVERALEAREADVFTEEHRQDGTLTAGLAALIGHLRKRRYGDLRRDVEEVISGQTRSFAIDLIDHLTYEEEVLFPALTDLRPEAEETLQGLRKEHDGFRDYTRRIAGSLRDGDTPAAGEVARSFLAALMDHIERETEVVDRLIGPMDFRTAARLGRRLLERRIKTKFRRKAESDIPGAQK